MKELKAKLFNARSVRQKKGFLESRNILRDKVFNELDIKELIDLFDNEFENEQGGFTSPGTFKISGKLHKLDLALLKYRDKIIDLIQNLSAEISESEKLNTEDTQKLNQQREALRLEARYDWYGKFRTFLFSVMGAGLFIMTIFTIGYIEKNYDWAVLPLAKYVEVSPEKLNDAHQVSELKLTNLATESPDVVEKGVKPIDKAISDK